MSHILFMVVILLFTFYLFVFFFSSRRRHTRCLSDWSSDVCSSDLLELTLDGERLALSPIGTALEMAPGAGGLRTLRLDATYRADLPRPGGELTFRDHNYADRPGWQEVVATPAGGARVTGATVPGSDVSHALRAYPQNMLQAPLRVSEARMRIAPGSGG